MIARREFVTVLGAATMLCPLLARAQQQSGKIARLGFLGATTPSGVARRIEALRAGLRDLGYIEGENILIDFRWAEGKYERLPELAAELVRLKVDLLVTGATPATLAAKQASTTIPIVMATVSDAVVTGLVASLARPGGNITGSTFFGPELYAKRLEALRDALPRIIQVAVLFNANNPAKGPIFQATQAAATSLKMKLEKFEVQSPAEFEGVFAEMVKRRIDAFVMGEDSMLVSNDRTIADLAIKKRLPSIGGRDLAEVGGLMSYGVIQEELYRRAAVFIDKILKGAKPADLPVEQPTKFELVINLKTAKALGITMPPMMVARADEVIE